MVFTLLVPGMAMALTTGVTPRMAAQRATAPRMAVGLIYSTTTGTLHACAQAAD